MNDTRIASTLGRRIWDSRGRPTVEVEVRLRCGAIGRGLAPAGASTGSGEALDLRDGGSRLGGLDVQKALSAVNELIATSLSDQDASQQSSIDSRLIGLDGTPNKSRLGGNATIAVSMAVLNASAAAHQQPLWLYLSAGNKVLLPLPEIQIFGGGAHASRRVDVQDFMIMPLAAASFAQALDWTAEVYRAAGDLMKSAGKLQGVADEGGYWPNFQSNEEALEYLVRSIESAGFKPDTEIGISLDIAASQFGRNGSYRLALDDRQLSTLELISMLSGWVRDYPIVSIEDPLTEDDTAGFACFTEQVGKKCQVIGDDFLVTNEARIKQAIGDRSLTAALIKPNQVGTITETIAALATAKAGHLGTIVSARSGETEDTTIAHLAVGLNAGQLKVGSFSRSERMAKWNECLRIEAALGSDAVFAGRSALTFSNGK